MSVTDVTSDAALAAAEPTTRFRRTAAAIALPLAFAFQLLVNTAYAWTTTTSGLTDTGSMAETQELYRTFAGLSPLMTTGALIGVLLAIPGLLAALRVVRPAKPRLGLSAVVLMMLGYVCYFGMNFSGYDTLALSLADIDLSVLDTSPIRAWQLPFFLLFAIGNLVGTLLLGLAVALGGRRLGVPWWTGLLIAGWTIGHVINISGGGEWFAVAGGMLEVVGLSILASHALRLTDTEWVARG